MKTDRHPAGKIGRREAIGIVLLVLVGLALRFWGQRAQVINLLFDEGIYLNLMQMEAEGRGALYKDIIFGHPPAVIWIGAWLWPLVKGDIVLIRMIYAAGCMLGFAPMYAIARKLRGVRAAQITLLLMATSPGFATWLGRTVFMELPQNVLIYAALWMLVCLPSRNRWIPFGAGVLLALSFLIKETALPIAFALGIALIAKNRMERGRMQAASKPSLVSFLLHPATLFAAGFVVTLGLLALWLARIPNCLQLFVSFYSLSRNTNDPYQMRQHFYELLNGFYALPIPLTFGLWGTITLLRQKRNSEEYFLAFYALLIAVILFVVPPRYYWRYWMPSVPIFCLGVAVWWERFTEAARPAARVAAFTLLGLLTLVHLAGLILYNTVEAVNPPAYTTALETLRRLPGPIFTLDPIWNAASGQSPLLWKHLGGDVHGRQRDFLADPRPTLEVIAQSPTVVLDRETVYWTSPALQDFLNTHYKTLYRSGVQDDRGAAPRTDEQTGVGELPDLLRPIQSEGERAGSITRREQILCGVFRHPTASEGERASL